MMVGSSSDGTDASLPAGALRRLVPDSLAKSSSTEMTSILSLPSALPGFSSGFGAGRSRPRRVPNRPVFVALSLYIWLRQPGAGCLSLSLVAPTNTSRSHHAGRHDAQAFGGSWQLYSGDRGTARFPSTASTSIPPDRNRKIGSAVAVAHAAQPAKEFAVTQVAKVQSETGLRLVPKRSETPSIRSSFSSMDSTTPADAVFRFAQIVHDSRTGAARSSSPGPRGTCLRPL